MQKNGKNMDGKLGLFLLYTTLSVVLALPTHNLKKRVVNGNTIIRGEWPFLVSLHYMRPFPFTKNSKMDHLCGGSLIHPQWVLTAAHCIGFFEDLAKPENWRVVVGEYNQYIKDEGEQVIQPEAFFIHPGFNPHQTNTLEDDIGLIKLKEPAVLGPYVGMVPTDNRTAMGVNTRCMIGGWGQISKEPYGWGMYIPLESTLYSFDNRLCKTLYDSIHYEEGMLHMKIDDSVMCAGIPLERQSDIERRDGGVSDACSGDSGSPLVCESSTEGEFILSGIVSAGKDCGSSLYPGIYTKLAFYQDWMQDTMSNNV